MQSGKGNVDIGNWKVELGKWKVERGTRKMVPGTCLERRSGIGSRRGIGLEVKLKVESGMLKVECG